MSPLEWLLQWRGLTVLKVLAIDSLIDGRILFAGQRHLAAVGNGVECWIGLLSFALLAVTT